jgi:hypothetical protein
MSYSLLIDDERDPPNDGRKWRIARSLDQVKTCLSIHGAPIFVSFDHDLGDKEPTGHDIAKAMVDGDLGERSDSGFAIGFHPNFTYYVHSQNPVGKSNIEGLLVNYLRHKNSK